MTPGPPTPTPIPPWRPDDAPVIPVPYVVLQAPWLLKILDRLPFSDPNVPYRTLWPVILTRRLIRPNEERHEAIHAAQQFEIGVSATLLCALLAMLAWSVEPLWGIVWSWLPVLGPYSLIYYGTEALAFLKYGDADAARRRAPMEQEALAHQGDPGYLANRPSLGWLAYPI